MWQNQILWMTIRFSDYRPVHGAVFSKEQMVTIESKVSERQPDHRLCRQSVWKSNLPENRARNSTSRLPTSKLYTAQITSYMYLQLCHEKRRSDCRFQSRSHWTNNWYQCAKSYTQLWPSDFPSDDLYTLKQVVIIPCKASQRQSDYRFYV